MSRAARRYKKWERDTRKSAWEEARQLAIDLYYGQAGPVNPYGIGMALEPGEVMYRQVWARYWTLGQPLDLVNGCGAVRFVPSPWRDWGWCPTVLTSHRLVTRLGADGGRLISNWWASIGGVQVDLSRDLVTLDDPRAPGAARTVALPLPSSRSVRSAQCTAWLLWWNIPVCSLCGKGGPGLRRQRDRGATLGGPGDPPVSLVRSGSELVPAAHFWPPKDSNDRCGKCSQNDSGAGKTIMAELLLKVGSAGPASLRSRRPHGSRRLQRCPPASRGGPTSHLVRRGTPGPRPRLAGVASPMGPLRRSVTPRLGRVAERPTPSSRRARDVGTEPGGMA